MTEGHPEQETVARFIRRELRQSVRNLAESTVVRAVDLRFSAVVAEVLAAVKRDD